jgi:hypothetical protein
LGQIRAGALEFGIFGEKPSHHRHHFRSRLTMRGSQLVDQPRSRAGAGFPHEVDPPFLGHELERAPPRHMRRELGDRPRFGAALTPPAVRPHAPSPLGSLREAAKR